MKKILIVLCVVLAVVFVFQGCASIKKAETFNGVNITDTPNKKNVAHYNGKNWGLYFLFIPLITGDADKVSEVTSIGGSLHFVFLKDNVTVDGVANMITKVSKNAGADSVEDLYSSRGCFPILFPLFYIKSVQMSANAVK